jgi:nitrate/TMAO reductase-like tetraheme cytochrome c subunit
MGTLGTIGLGTIVVSLVLLVLVATLLLVIFKKKAKNTLEVTSTEVIKVETHAVNTTDKDLK